MSALTSSKKRNIRTKVLVTVAVIILYVIGKNIKAPGFDGTVIDIMSNSFLSMLSLMGGGIIEQMSIFSLGVGPYLTASIIISLLSMEVIPALDELRKDGTKGQKKIDYITFCLGTVMAVIQGYFLARSLATYVVNPGVKSYLFIAAILTFGSIITYGLGKAIDKWGIGNGISMIIFAGIVSEIPYSFERMYQTLDTKWFIGYCLLYLLIIIGVIIVQLAERRIPIQYSKAINTTKGSLSHLPLKINSASVMPVIFASAVIQAPLIITSWINYGAYEKLSNLTNMDNWYMIAIYALLIILFTFFYANLQVDPQKVAGNISKNGGYIPGTRPGKETKEYISKVLNSITVLGSVLLALLAVLPNIISKLTGKTLSLAGTSIIILVGVAVELVSAMKSEVTENKYKSFVGK